jgi:hypothetical protein
MMDWRLGIFYIYIGSLGLSIMLDHYKIKRELKELKQIFKEINNKIK